ncbi:hypothetical protein R84B8_02200 [Treponema sp. R8-4-B8]
MKKYFLAAGLLFVSLSVFAQSIDRSQYKEIDLFSYIVEGKQKGSEYSVKYKMVVKFSFQTGTAVIFQDDAGDSVSLQTTKRWSLNKGQFVTVYLSARNKGGYWSEEKLDDLETSTTSSVKPWLPYVSNGKTGLHGWYLQDMGNGTYKEIYFE